MDTVLLVADGGPVQRRLGEALEGQGYEVEMCPGPSPPGYVCIGGAGGRCPLAASAAVVVIDCAPASDEAARGTGSWQLVAYYRGLGLPVVALCGPGDPRREMDDPGVLTLSRRAPRRAVVEAVARAIPRAG